MDIGHQKHAPSGFLQLPIFMEKFQDGLTGSAWGDWSQYTDSPLRAFENELGVQAAAGLMWLDEGRSFGGETKLPRVMMFRTCPKVQCQVEPNQKCSLEADSSKSSSACHNGSKTLDFGLNIRQATRHVAHASAC